MAYAAILLPIAAGLAALLVPSNRWRPWLLPAAGLAHLLLSMRALSSPTAPALSGWLVLDALGRVVLLLVSVVFLLCAVYAVGYLHHRADRPNRTFCACLLAFLGTMTLAAWSHHLGLMWVAVEATTLVGAPLIYFNRTARSLEAVWKYLLVGSVGIAMALLGSFFLAYASLHAGLPSSLHLDELLRTAPLLSRPWLHAAFVLLLVGYGTKMGLAPMHTWKPDAYGEAPGLAGALFAGCMTSCALLMILRVFHICTAAGEAAFAQRLLLGMGLFSMGIAAAFMVRQRDFKRMLAYSSVEHMGILAVGIGVGGPALFGALLHMVNNALTKGVLFLSAGNIHRAYGSKSIDQVSGALRRLPLSGWLFLGGFLAVTGSPPFGPFVSEFSIISAAVGSGWYGCTAVFLVLLLVVFIGMGATVLTVVQGQPSKSRSGTEYRDSWLTGGPVVLLMSLVLLLGLYIPTPLRDLLADAVRFLESRP